MHVWSNSQGLEGGGAKGGKGGQGAKPQDGTWRPLNEHKWEYG